MSGSGKKFIDASTRRRVLEVAVEEIEESKSAADINAYLQGLLSEINDRNSELINDRLHEIEQELGEVFELDRLLFGGSVAKHTFVNGLSDIDALVILDGNTDTHNQPSAMREAFAQTLRERLKGNDIREILAGNLAVTVHYRDGTEIQLLPAMERGSRFVISSPDGNSWSSIAPRRFARRLTEVNQRNSGMVIPAIKLAKSLLDSQLGNRTLSGHHIETLAVDAFERYQGPYTPQAMLSRLIDRARVRVFTSMPDVTGQSQSVDDQLGRSYSPHRKSLASELNALSERLVSGELSDWRELFE